MNYSIETEEDHEIEDYYLKNYDLNNNDDVKIENTNNINLDDIYNNTTLMADILFQSLCGIDNLKVNCFLNSGIAFL